MTPLPAAIVRAQTEVRLAQARRDGTVTGARRRLKAVMAEELRREVKRRAGGRAADLFGRGR